MTSRASAQQANLEVTGVVPPYSPSWVDRVTGWVDQLPVPNWMFYAGLGIILVLAESIIQWQAGNYPVGVFDPFHIYFACVIAYFLALVHYLDKTAARAWEEFQPALDSSQAGARQLEYELTTLPARPTLLVSLAGAVIAVVVLLTSAPPVEQLRMANMAASAPSFVFNIILYILNWFVTSTVIYHVAHQLGVVNRIYRHTRIDLYELGPLYTFSRLSARTAVGLAIAMYLPAFISLAFSGYAIWTVLRVLVIVIVGLTFVLPLLGIHRLIAKEKERLLSENSRQLKASFIKLHRRLESNDLSEVENLTKAIDGLESEQKVLKSISTWPWQPETPRAVLAAVLLPVVVWFIQWLLQRILET